MKITSLKIKNALGVESLEISTGDVTEISGKKGSGKTSILDAIKMTIDNKCGRSEFVKKGNEEALLYVELSDGTTIDRKKRTEKSDYVKVSGQKGSPESFLKSLFSEEQFNPLKFMDMTTKEQNKVLLSLVEDNVTAEQMSEWFGELPNLSFLQSQHILSKLDYLQSKQSVWYLERKELNHNARHTATTAEDLMSNIPNRFDVDIYESIDLSVKYAEIEKKRVINENLIKADGIIKDFEGKKINIKNKYRLEYNEILDTKKSEITKVEYEINEEVKVILENKKEITNIILEKEDAIKKLTKEIEILENKEEVLTDNVYALEMNEEFEKRTMNIIKIYNIKKLGIANNEILENKKEKEKVKLSKKYIKENEINKIDELLETAKEFEDKKALIPNYLKSIMYLHNIENLKNQSEKLTEKIELARELPGELLKKGKLPISGMKLENGIIKILNMSDVYVTVDGLSEGEKLELCIDIAVAKTGELKTVLVDGFEKLDKESRKAFIKKAKKSGLQYFITRVANGELEIKEY